MATKKGIRRRSAMQGGKEKPRLGGVSLSELKAEIRRRERQLAMLHRKRDRLLAELESLEQEIATQAARTVTTARAQHMAADHPLTGVVEMIGLMVAKMDVLGTDPVAKTDARVIEVDVRIDEGQDVATLTYLQVTVQIEP